MDSVWSCDDFAKDLIGKRVCFRGNCKTPFGVKSALFPLASNFSQSAYGQKDMSLCEKSNQRKNHRI